MASSMPISARVRPLPGRGARLELGIGRQRLDGAVELAARLQLAHQPQLVGEVVQAVPLLERDRQRLLVVVAEHQRRHVVGHLAQQLQAVVRRQAAAARGGRQRDLDVHLDVGGVDAGGIVDGVGIAAPALQPVGDARPLRHAEIGALAHDLGADLRSR